LLKKPAGTREVLQESDRLPSLFINPVSFHSSGNIAIMQGDKMSNRAGPFFRLSIATDFYVHRMDAEQQRTDGSYTTASGKFA